MTIPLHPNSAPPLPDPANPAAASTVSDDIPCRKCAYNLRSMPVSGNCPECGTPVSVSIFGNLLRFSDPAWVDKLARGARHILVGTFLLIAVIICAVAGGAFMRASGAIRPATFQIIFQLLTLGANVLIVVGSWFITEPDPSGIGEDEYGTARKVVRVTLLFGIVNSLVNIATSMAVLPPIGRQLLMAIGALSSIMNAVGLIAQLLYFAKLANRIPDPSLAARANYLKVALSTTYFLLILIGIVGGLMAVGRGVAAANSGIIMAVGCVAAIIFLALLVFGVMYLFMIDRFRRQFRQQALLAQQAWSARPQIPSPI